LVSAMFAGENFENFITVKKGKLYDGDEEFRFVSWNIPNLNFVEDEMLFQRKHAFRLPNEYEIRDAMESVDQLGGRVIRSYTIPVIRESDTPDIPRYVLGPGKFDEESFKCMDTVLALANETGIRLIVPLLNNWKWMGGVPQYAGFRNKEFKDFWEDPQLIADFKKTIDYVLNRTNTITGVKYKDDKSILCWETGNELQSTPEWTSEIVKYIKSIDKNHLVMDGYHSNRLREISITDPNIDIVTTHHYESTADELLENMEKNLQDLKGKKPYVLGEFGFLSTTAMTKILDEVIATDIAGALIWSLRHHRREGGFYWHSEPLGGGLYKAYHFPGFASGDEYDETGVIDMMRTKAYEIQGKA
ncbi:MAG TPA: cellulase family glycosylhydrolase, partial [Bacteroidales bacterium]|nr:cellulase family glycosylhydrolase [Bacteroidales bacterium]